MNAIDLGNLLLGAALLAATVSVLLALAATRFISARLLIGAKAALALVAVLLTVASTVLAVLLVGSDFRVEYVAHYTERALPLGYKIAAFWAGQQGSLLLWAWALSMMCVIAVLATGSEETDVPKFRQTAIASAVLAAVLGFFVALILCAATPFQAGPAVDDGQGLNPMLQNIGMIAHPPILFLGYAASTVPFAFMIGALIAGRSDEWLTDIRRWTLAAWLFLTVGILLGAQWAYVELGWGGYWAWDPVENASLLPWLTATGLLHSIISQQRKGMFRGWTAGLVASTFILCIFGTYLTRSGVVQSVHAFQASSVGTFFLVFLCLSIVATLVVISLRWKSLKPAAQLDGWLNRESAVLAGNILLVAMMLITLFGTVFPLISRAFASQPVSVNAAYYNKGVLPLGLCLVLAMAMGPALDAGKLAAPALRRLRWPAALAVAAPLVACTVWQTVSPWLIVVSAVCVGAVACFVQETARAWHARRHNLGENAPLALWRLFDANHRRYGGQIVHMGMAMIVAGIAGSSLLGVKQDVQLKLGQTIAFAGGTLSLADMHQVTEPNFQAVEAVVTFTDAHGAATTLRPQRRFYKGDESSSEVAIRSSLARDVYVNLAGWEAGGDVVSFQAFVNPLVNWIWIGGIVVAGGALFCLLPRLEPSKVLAAEAVEPASEGTAETGQVIAPAVVAAEQNTASAVA